MATRSTHDIVATLNRLIEVNTDAEKGYANASAEVRSPVLKGNLADRSKDCSERVMALQNAVTLYGAYPENEGTFKGTLHRGWMGTRRVVEGPSDLLVLEECERGESAAMKAYESISPTLLGEMSPDLVQLLHEQRVAFHNARAETLQRLHGMLPGRVRGGHVQDT